MSNQIKGLTLKLGHPQRKGLAFLAFCVGVLLSFPAWAQYSGGNQSGSAESTIGTDIFKGGAQGGSNAATSGAIGSLSHGAPAKLVFTVTPSATKHFLKFERQPVVQVQDAAGNLASSDNATQVTLEIVNNPGNALLLGTSTVTVVNGVARFTDLQVNRAGSLYTLKAKAPGLTPGISPSFDILAGTGVRSTAAWDNSTGAYTIYSWVDSGDQRVPLTRGDTCNTHI